MLGFLADVTEIPPGLPSTVLQGSAFAVLVAGGWFAARWMMKQQERSEQRFDDMAKAHTVATKEMATEMARENADALSAVVADSKANRDAFTATMVRYHDELTTQIREKDRQIIDILQGKK